MNLIQKLEKRSNALLLNKLLMKSLYKIQEENRLKNLAEEMTYIPVEKGGYDMADKIKFLWANGIKPF